MKASVKMLLFLVNGNAAEIIELYMETVMGKPGAVVGI